MKFSKIPIFLFSIIFIDFLLSGCATTPFPISHNPHKTYEQYLRTHQNIKNFTAQGLIEIKANNQIQEAQFIWLEKNNLASIELYGPLGLGATYIQENSKGVTLTNPNHQIDQADNAEQLMQEILGWSVPVEGLKYWILGIPKDNFNFDSNLNYHFNSYGFLNSLDQDSWEINYPSYKNFNSKFEPKIFPEKLILIRKIRETGQIGQIGQIGKELKIIIIIHSLTLPTKS